MKSVLFKDKFPVFTKEIEKGNYNVETLIDFFQNKISSHPVATFITVFDHYNHTKSLTECNIAEDIVDVKNIVFCFGKEIPSPIVPAVRPRSIAVVETKNNFVISFMEAPNETLSKVMQEWVKEL